MKLTKYNIPLYGFFIAWRESTWEYAKHQELCKIHSNLCDKAMQEPFESIRRVLDSTKAVMSQSAITVSAAKNFQISFLCTWLPLVVFLVILQIVNIISILRRSR